MATESTESTEKFKNRTKKQQGGVKERALTKGSRKFLVVTDISVFFRGFRGHKASYYLPRDEKVN